MASETKEARGLTRFGGTDGKELILNDRQFEDALARAQEQPKDTVSDTVTFLGDTHSGKSTLIQRLITAIEKLEREDPDAKAGLGRMPSVAADDQADPTTSDVHVYHVGSGGLQFLDMEGENGGRPPVLDDTEIDEATLTQYMERRRECVKRHFPRLAYVISDVVVFTAEIDIANHQFKERVAELAASATDNVKSSEKPSLLLLPNKRGLKAEYDVEKATKIFFEQHDPDYELQEVYQEVRVVQLPDWDISSKKLNIDGEELFDEQMLKVQTVLGEMVKARHKQKVALGNVFHPSLWLQLFRMVVAEFNNKSGLRMGKLMTVATLPQSDVWGQVLRRFQALYECYSTICERERRFRDARDYAVWALAGAYAHKFMFVAEQAHSSVITSAAKRKAVIEDAEQSVLRLLSFVKRLRPCCAVYKGPKKIASGNNAVYCQEDGMTHGTEHRNFNEHFVTTSLWKKAKMRLMNVGNPVVWDKGTAELEFDEKADNDPHDRGDLHVRFLRIMTSMIPGGAKRVSTMMNQTPMVMKAVFSGLSDIPEDIKNIPSPPDTPETNPQTAPVPVGTPLAGDLEELSLAGERNAARVLDIEPATSDDAKAADGTLSQQVELTRHRAKLLATMWENLIIRKDSHVTSLVDSICSLCITNENDTALSCGHKFCASCISLSRSLDAEFISLISKRTVASVGKQCPYCSNPIKSVTST